MSAFSVIMERACRDRAVTQHQMETFRQAWSGVTSLLVIDPTILPTSNNQRSIPFELLKEAFPNMSWKQPRGNMRGMLITPRYMTPPFAEELGMMIGCAAERGSLPPFGIPPRGSAAASDLLRNRGTELSRNMLRLLQERMLREMS